MTTQIQLAFKAAIYICCFLEALSANINNLTWEQYYDHNTWMDQYQQYRMYWSVNELDNTVEIGLIVNTTGYIGWGVSEDGSMHDADIRLAWIDHETNELYFQHRYTEHTHAAPTFESNMDDSLLSLIRNGTWTELRFSRLMHPCPEDYKNPKQIIIGSTRIIFAFNNENPLIDDNNPNGLPSYHGPNKGSQSINFHEGILAEVEMPSDVEIYAVTMENYTLLPVDTIYYCKFIEINRTFDETVHYIRYDPIVQPGNEANVHHLVLAKCGDVFDPVNVGVEGVCDDIVDVTSNCHDGNGFVTLAIWAVGGGNFYFPENVGFEITGRLYVRINIHYDNPLLLSDIVDSSGLRLYFTETLRGTSASKIKFVAPYEAQFIPGGMPLPVTHKVIVPSNCTTEIPDTGAKIFAIIMHSHMAGQAMQLRHIRNNIELEPLAMNKHYDFNYQQFVPVESVEIQKGDEFILECTRDVSSRVYPTYGGESTWDEMCGVHMYAYPKINFTLAQSTVTYEQFYEFFDIAILNGWWNGTRNYTINEQNKFNFFYDSSTREAQQHYYGFVDKILLQQEVICGNGFNQFMLSPEARDNFIALEEEDICALDSKSTDLTRMDIVFITIGCFVALILIILIVKYYYQKKKKTYTSGYDTMVDIILDTSADKKEMYGSIKNADAETKQ